MAVTAGLLTGGGTATAGTDSASGTVVRTEYGALRGTADGATRVFQGIPYAAPPGRWQEPTPPARWDGVRDATEPGPVCAQLPGEVPDGSVSEDCLTLNVTAPANGRRKPVVVWVHGGGFFMGAGSNYDARRLAERGDAVVVTINYRLGVFGYFGLPGLKGSGTFGLRDQQTALRWVRHNAGAFGGDPHNVTIAGQSAGAMSACAQLTSPGAAGLFDRAILQSGSCRTEFLDNFEYPGEAAATLFQPLDDVAAHGVETAAALGCADAAKAKALACLRKLPVEDLMPVLQEFIMPAYDTPALPTYPGDAVLAGRFHHVPVLSGNTRDEATAWVAAYDSGQPMSEETLARVLPETFGADAAAVRAEYPGPAAQAWAAIVTDRMWACPQYETSQGLARRNPVFQYEFADPAPPPLSPLPPTMPLGTPHASDLWSFFDLGGATPPFTPAQERLSDQMIDYWTAFMATGDPDRAAGPRWPGFARNGYVQSLAPGDIAPVDLAAEHHCGFWAAR
jgi:para-nitrobenzyl esterase